jgi:catechol 2,3-dioxygenase-like lactoylglutathione lyase family enzyme/DNA-binding CsgD family transcriptional regulator
MTSERQRGRPPFDDVLTPAEWRVAEAVRHGLTNPEIARLQGVSADAVKYHVANATGIRRDSNLFRKELSMAPRLELGAIRQIARTVRDIEESRRWYRDVLGLKHLYSYGNLAFFDCDGLRLFLSEGEGSQQESIIYFNVDDVRTAHAALLARGVQFIDAPHLIHRHEDGAEEWMAAFNDNEGRPLAVMALVRPG